MHLTFDFHLLSNCQITSSFISDILDSSSAAFIKFVMVVRLTEHSIIERVKQEWKCVVNYNNKKKYRVGKRFLCILSEYWSTSRCHPLSCILPVVSVYRQKMTYRLQWAMDKEDLQRNEEEGKSHLETPVVTQMWMIAPPVQASCL